jgi:phospholipase C
VAGLQEIDTIVVVMLENRSFDNVLGHLRHPKYGDRAEVDGLRDPQTTADYDNFFDGQVYKPFPTTDKAFRHDFPHDRAGIATQLDVVNGQATMAGFVQAYVDKTQSTVKRPPPLGFLKPKMVPVSGFLAREYGLCDRWFAPLPTGTQPNRAVAFSGTSRIDDNVIGLIPYDELVFDWLEARNVRWRVYHSGLSFFLLFGRIDDALGPHFRSVRRLAQDFLDEDPAAAPQVVFIEPEYEDSPVHLGYVPNDNHPPLPIGPGEVFLHGIYTALTRNRARWARTLLVVTYDEHGGFYDHVEPAPVRLDPAPNARFTDPFETTGVRVPALVASPWVPRGGVCKARLDHTSILQLLAEKFAGGPNDYSPEVTRRREQGIESLSRVLALPAPRADVPAPPAAAIEAKSIVRGGAKKSQTENQVAFAAAARTCLASDRPRALDRFPELAVLPPED